MSELARRSVEAGTATITLDSPANRNALSRQLRRDLLDALHATEEDDSRVVVLAHTGSVFCAGTSRSPSRRPRSRFPRSASASSPQ
jgi:methylglutaconyl-CoA hydratase